MDNQGLSSIAFYGKKTRKGNRGGSSEKRRFESNTSLRTLPGQRSFLRVQLVQPAITLRLLVQTNCFVTDRSYSSRAKNKQPYSNRSSAPGRSLCISKAAREIWSESRARAGEVKRSRDSDRRRIKKDPNGREMFGISFSVYKYVYKYMAGPGARTGKRARSDRGTGACAGRPESCKEDFPSKKARPLLQAGLVVPGRNSKARTNKTEGGGGQRGAPMTD